MFQKKKKYIIADKVPEISLKAQIGH